MAKHIHIHLGDNRFKDALTKSGLQNLIEQKFKSFEGHYNDPSRQVSKTDVINKRRKLSEDLEQAIRSVTF